MFEGEVHPLTYWVEDFGAIDIYAKQYISALDHRNLNDILENPTAEALVDWFLAAFKQTVFADKHKISVRVWETPKCYAEGTL
jgi:6-pyruvoyl-tetrahydropterin synthase